MNRRRKNELQDANDFMALVSAKTMKMLVSKGELAMLRRVAKLHMRLLKPQMCECCIRLVALSHRIPVCEECACGAHQTDCPRGRKAHMAFGCIDCGNDFWLHEDEGRKLTTPPVCDSCRRLRSQPRVDND